MLKITLFRVITQWVVATYVAMCFISLTCFWLNEPLRENYTEDIKEPCRIFSSVLICVIPVVLIQYLTIKQYIYTQHFIIVI